MVINKVTLAFIFFVTCVSLSGQRNEDFKLFDKDDNKHITREEFSLVFDLRYMDKWMKRFEKNVAINSDLFFERVWDVDRNRFLSKEEWISGPKKHLDFLSDFDTVDENDDHKISQEEFQSIDIRASIIEAWDLNEDSALSDFEIMKGVFAIWDFDNSDTIEYDEFLSFDEYHKSI